MEDKKPRIPRWLKWSLIVFAVLFALAMLFGTGGRVRDAEAASNGTVKLCDKSGKCVTVTEDRFNKGKVDPSKTRSTTEVVAVASQNRNERCTGRVRVREYANLFGQTLARTRLSKNWCYNPRTDRITHVFKPSLTYETTWLGSHTGWEDAGDSIQDEWIPSGNNRRFAHDTIGTVKFRRCFEAFLKVCLGNVRIITRIRAYGDGR